MKNRAVHGNGRAGLPLLGLIPVLGRLFTSPTRENRRIDIVIAVTPREDTNFLGGLGRRVLRHDTDNIAFHD